MMGQHENRAVRIVVRPRGDAVKRSLQEIVIRPIIVILVLRSHRDDIDAVDFDQFVHLLPGVLLETLRRI